MKRIVVLLVLVLVVFFFYQYGRSIWHPLILKIKGKETVNSIIEKYDSSVKKRLFSYLTEAGFDDYPKKIALLAFKEEQKLEVLAFKNDQWKKVKDYNFTGFSGSLGPKLKEGDKQIPEGMYFIEFLNPNSSYHLSLKVSYPNKYDVLKGKVDNREKLGDNIFIHGNNVTVGCIPIGDKAIEELFILVSNAFNQKVNVIISPRDFRVNPHFPTIENIDWENELYKNIQNKLTSYTVK